MKQILRYSQLTDSQKCAVYEKYYDFLDYYYSDVLDDIAAEIDRKESVLYILPFDGESLVRKVKYIRETPYDIEFTRINLGDSKLKPVVQMFYAANRSTLDRLSEQFSALSPLVKVNAWCNEFSPYHDSLVKAKENEKGEGLVHWWQEVNVVSSYDPDEWQDEETWERAYAIGDMFYKMLVTNIEEILQEVYDESIGRLQAAAEYQYSSEHYADYFSDDSGYAFEVEDGEVVGMFSGCLDMDITTQGDKE